ncbi:MAG: hypothetical protein WC747_00140 [Candidatus Babeliales bacterium]|jgi:hypothetical protein
MVTKKFISLSLLLVTPTSFMQCSVPSSAPKNTTGITIERNSKSIVAATAPQAIASTTATAPKAIASSTSSHESPNSDSEYNIIPSDSATIIGQPYPTVTIDPTTQNKSFKVGKTAIDGNHKGIRETSLDYVLRLARDGQLTEALTEPIRKQQKTRERFNEGIIDADDDLTKIATAQSIELKNFSAQQAAAATTFFNTKKAATTTFLARQRAASHKATSSVDTVLQIVLSMPDAKGSLSDVCIREELAKLQAVQRQKEEALKLQQSTAKTLLQQLTETLTSLSQQQEDEYLAQIVKIRELRELLHSSHPAPKTIDSLSPRPAAEVKTKK